MGGGGVGWGGLKLVGTSLHPCVGLHRRERLVLVLADQQWRHPAKDWPPVLACEALGLQPVEEMPLLVALHGNGCKLKGRVLLDQPGREPLQRWEEELGERRLLPQQIKALEQEAVGLVDSRTHLRGGRARACTCRGSSLNILRRVMRPTPPW